MILQEWPGSCFPDVLSPEMVLPERSSFGRIGWGQAGQAWEVPLSMY